VADELNTSRSKVYALVRDRSVIAVKIGGRGQWRVERARLKAIARLYCEAEARDPPTCRATTAPRKLDLTHGVHRHPDGPGLGGRQPGDGADAVPVVARAAS
jgi:excisionase family DNA binding protein